MLLYFFNRFKTKSRLLVLLFLCLTFAVSGCFSFISNIDPVVDLINNEMAERYLPSDMRSNAVQVPEDATLHIIDSSEDMFYAIQEELYSFSNTLYFQVDSFQVFSDFWDNLSNKNVLHSTFQEIDLYLEYDDKSPTIIRMTVELNVTGILLNHFHNDTLDMIEDSDVLILMETAQSILSEVVDHSMNERDIGIALHDYIIRNTVYLLDDERPELSTAYGVLVKGEGQCQGYSEAYALLMRMAGVETRVISGSSLDNNAQYQPHAWNQVRIDGVWYHVDVTWDDPVPDMGDEVRHDYLYRSDSFLSRQHNWSSLFPECPVDAPLE